MTQGKFNSSPPDQFKTAILDPETAPYEQHGKSADEIVKARMLVGVFALASVALAGLVTGLVENHAKTPPRPAAQTERPPEILRNLGPQPDLGTLLSHLPH